MKKQLIFFGYGLLLLMWGASSVHAQFPSAINLDTIGDNGLMISRVVKAVPVTPVPPTFPILQPGTGWTGPTEQPDTIGDSSMSGYDAKAIARWDVVPYQTFDDQFHIGVVAFHMNGIDRVSFSVDNGPWVDVHEMKLNPRTDVEEYTVTLDANLFTEDGAIEVRAIVYPTIGLPRVLGGDVQYEDASSNWYDPNVDGVGEPTNTLWTGEYSLWLNIGEPQAIELEEGTYTWGEGPLSVAFGGNPHVDAVVDPNDDQWIIWRAAPGADPARVIINNAVTSKPWTDSEGFTSTVNFSKIKLENLTIVYGDRDSNESNGILTYVARDIVWYDGVTVLGAGANKSFGSGTPGCSHIFLTNTTFNDLRGGSGHLGNRHSGTFVRNTTFERIGEKALRTAYFVVNSTFKDINEAENLVFHASAISNPLRHDNRIYYNLEMLNVPQALAFRSESWILNRMVDVAVVNVNAEHWLLGSDFLVLLGGTVRNVYFKDSRFVSETLHSHAFAYRNALPPEDPRFFTPELLVFENVNFNDDPNWLPGPADQENVYFRP